jgi:very-short-patch-repair endonuclease
MRTFLARHEGGRGVRNLRIVIDGGQPALTRSDAEERFLDLVRRADIDPPAVNSPIAGHEVDFMWRGKGLVAEIDGFAFHASRGAFERDRRRDAALAAAGLRVMRVTWQSLESEPFAVVARLAQALAR